jgi:hypothetical protein
MMALIGILFHAEDAAQYFLYGSMSGSAWIHISLAPRIWIRLRNVDLDPDPHAVNVVN